MENTQTSSNGFPTGPNIHVGGGNAPSVPADTTAGNIHVPGAAPVAQPAVTASAAPSAPAAPSPEQEILSKLPPPESGYKYVLNGNRVAQVPIVGSPDERYRTIRDQLAAANNLEAQPPASETPSVTPTTSSATPPTPPSTPPAPSNPAAIRKAEAIRLINSGDAELYKVGLSILQSINGASAAPAAPAASQPKAPVFDRDAKAAEIRERIKAELIADARKPKYVTYVETDAEGNEVKHTAIAQDANGNPLYESINENDWAFKQLLAMRVENELAKAESAFTREQQVKVGDARALNRLVATFEASAEAPAPSWLAQDVPDALVDNGTKVSSEVFGTYQNLVNREVERVSAILSGKGLSLSSFIADRFQGDVEAFALVVHNEVIKLAGPALKAIAIANRPSVPTVPTAPPATPSAPAAPFTVPQAKTTAATVPVAPPAVGAGVPPVADPVRAKAPEPQYKFGTGEHHLESQRRINKPFSERLADYRRMAGLPG